MSERAFLPRELNAIQTFFGGDRDLYLGFRAASQGQFQVDSREADEACAAQDRAALRRVVHSLKSVFQLLGEADLCAQVAALERSASQADWQSLLDGWKQLQGSMAQRELL